MSEYQYIGFRAVDGPVSKKNLEYMEDQSTRAEITPWSFDNEYHFGDFGGNAVEMLRRGYDIHLHYANFGIRTLLIRLPIGLPAPEAVKPYLQRDRLSLLKDKKGPGCILSICPYYESDSLEDIWDPGEIFDSLVGIRAEIIEGDLRPLYLAHLAISTDCEHDPEETKEAPVPAGLARLSEAQLGMAELYGLSDSLLAAAARESAPMPSSPSGRNSGNECADWVRSQPEKTKDAWLATLISDPGSNVRSEILAEFRASHKLPAWPVSRPGRTIAELLAVADEIASEAERKAEAAAARKRAKSLSKMAADPTACLRKTEKLVAQRTVDAYHEASHLLAELREALAGSDQSGLAEQHAEKLKKDNPTLHKLGSALREQGLVAK